MALTDAYHLEPVQKPYITKKVGAGVKGSEQIFCYFPDISEHNLVLRKNLLAPTRPSSWTSTAVDLERRSLNGYRAIRVAETALSLLSGIAFFVVLVSVYFLSRAVSDGNGSVVLASLTAAVAFSLIFLISLRFQFWIARRSI